MTVCPFYLITWIL